MLISRIMRSSDRIIVSKMPLLLLLLCATAAVVTVTSVQWVPTTRDKCEQEPFMYWGATGAAYEWPTFFEFKMHFEQAAALWMHRRFTAKVDTLSPDWIDNETCSHCYCVHLSEMDH